MPAQYLDPAHKLASVISLHQHTHTHTTARFNAIPLLLLENSGISAGPRPGKLDSASKPLDRRRTSSRHRPALTLGKSWLAGKVGRTLSGPRKTCARREELQAHHLPQNPELASACSHLWGDFSIHRESGNELSTSSGEAANAAVAALVSSSVAAARRPKTLQPSLRPRPSSLDAEAKEILPASESFDAIIYKTRRL